MARSDGLRSRAVLLSTATLVALVAAGCSDLPSKSDALAIVKQSVKEEATCTLPIAMLARFKMQHSSKAVCVPREGGAPMDEAWACVEALVAEGATRPMPGGYMAEWPDELSGTSFDAVSPYERRARDLVFKGCVEMVPGLREGQFRCGQARAEKVVRLTKQDDGRATVRYARAITFDPKLAAIDAACGAVTRPPPEGTVTIAMTADKKWGLAPESDAPPAGSTAAP